MSCWVMHKNKDISERTALGQILNFTKRKLFNFPEIQTKVLLLPKIEVLIYYYLKLTLIDV